MSITLKTLADEVGVSTATVSRALKNDRLISAETRSKVFAVAARIGYKHAGRKARSVGQEQPRLLLLASPSSRSAGNPTLNAFLFGMTGAAADLGCLLSVEEVRNEDFGRMSPREHLPQSIRHGGVDIVVVAYQHHPHDVQVLSKMLPLISFQWDYSVGSDMVVAFNTQGVIDLADRLVAVGHHRIAWVGDTYEASFFREREAGFYQACIKHRLEIHTEWNRHTTRNDEYPSLVKEFRKAGVTAVMCASDWVAHQMAEAALIQGLRIPEDISLTGFDARNERLTNGRVLTSYDPRFSELGRAAVQTAMQRLREPSASRILQSREGYICEGETVARAA